MKIWTPLETAWPAGALLLMLLGAALSGRRHLLPARPGPWIALGALSLAVRLVVLPALELHEYDGHEAEYWHLYLGELRPTRGGTVLYPSMQWLWWGLGRILPHWPQLPVMLAAIWGSLGVVWLAAALGRLAGGPDGRLVAGMAGVLAAVHPVHAAWSSSAYNVIWPATLGALALWCAAVVATTRRPTRPVAWLGAAALGLCVATRLDAALFLLPCAGLVLLVRPPGQPLGVAIRERLLLLPAAIAGAVLVGFAVYPLVYPGEVPGAGERALSFAINWTLLDVHLPVLAGPALALAAVGGALAATRWPLPTVVLVGSAVANHLAMASFDDFGDRHALTSLPGLLWGASAGGVVVAGAALGRGRTLRALLLPALLVGAFLAGLVDLRARYYAPEEAFLAALEAGVGAGLPRADPGRFKDGCGWVNEDPRVALDPVASHFNLIDPEEASALRVQGCLRWCLDLQDWRWSSRGVRDRARRLFHLYDLSPAGMVEEPTSGYSCLVLGVGARRCCHGASAMGFGPSRGRSVDAGLSSADRAGGGTALRLP